MSSVWLKLTAILCLSCTALSGPESDKVVWRKTGQAITIQCRFSGGSEMNLNLNKGLHDTVDVMYMHGQTEKYNIATAFSGRVQLNGKVPNVDILIKNLTSDDTGPYMCLYKWYDGADKKLKKMNGNGSVLLVVTEETKQRCETPQNQNENLVLVSVVISAAVLLGLITCGLIWLFIKTKTLRTTVKPRHVPNNDVYEDMRGTLRH